MTTINVLHDSLIYKVRAHGKAIVSYQTQHCYDSSHKYDLSDMI